MGRALEPVRPAGPPARRAAKAVLKQPVRKAPAPSPSRVRTKLSRKPALPAAAIVPRKPALPAAARGKATKVVTRVIVKPGAKPAQRGAKPAPKPTPAAPTTFKRADFSRGEVLGTGQFGVVRRCTEKRTGQVVALKAFDLMQVHEAEFTVQVRREVDLHTHLVHPHILRAYACFQDASKLHIVLEFAERGSLRDCLHGQDLKARTYLRSHAARLVRELCQALQYCHERDVIHRDVKLENLLLTREWSLKLADFGWAVRSAKHRSTLCGTPEYFAPELAPEDRKYDAGVDVWCAGIVAHELMLRAVPDMPLPPPEDDVWRHVPPMGQAFCRSLLVEMSQRPTVASALRHEWLQ